MGCRAYLVCLLLLTLTTCESQQRDIEKIDNTVAVVGRIFVYSLPNEGQNQGSYKVSDEL